MPRLRIRRITWPRRALVIGDTPRPDCLICAGKGGVSYGDYYDGDWEPCRCWDEDRYWVLLPLPRHGYSDEPPF
ncbi:hypothetical protein ACF06X_29200 [Streptomyces sp. NPDC015346]|uniref:hypothetical protein n=1 Tax=Streptomyces sp. NPDC015346 TaxID=3364954 RepID=UPI0037001447